MQYPTYPAPTHPSPGTSMPSQNDHQRIWYPSHQPSPSIRPSFPAADVRDRYFLNPNGTIPSPNNTQGEVVSNPYIVQQIPAPRPLDASLSLDDSADSRVGMPFISDSGFQPGVMFQSPFAEGAGMPGLSGATVGPTARGSAGVFQQGSPSKLLLGVGQNVPCSPIAVNQPHNQGTVNQPAMKQHQQLGPVSMCNSHDKNLIRKLRHRERSDKNNWTVRQPRVRSCKRNQKYMEDDSLSPHCKQFASDEKMAARMSGLSIYHSDNTNMTTLEERWARAQKQLQDIENRLSDTDSDDQDDDGQDGEGGGQIEVSPELRSALCQKETLLPEAVIKSIAKPNTQLVLWRPPESYITDVISKMTNQTSTDPMESAPGVDTPIVDRLMVDATLVDGQTTVEASLVDHHPLAGLIRRPGVEAASHLCPQGGWAANIPEQLFDSMDDDMDL